MNESLGGPLRLLFTVKYTRLLTDIFFAFFFSNSGNPSVPRNRWATFRKKCFYPHGNLSIPVIFVMIKSVNIYCFFISYRSKWNEKTFDLIEQVAWIDHWGNKIILLFSFFFLFFWVIFQEKCFYPYLFWNRSSQFLLFL